uniref:Uncharacterized protein n=1 Tax=Anguilla anguilla TaxID=7936 RepID=A0A0E9UXT0_ANGAN
MASHEPLC